MNTVKSFIGHTNSDLQTPNGNIWDCTETFFGYRMSEETHGGGKGEISPDNNSTFHRISAWMKCSADVMMLPKH